MHILLLFLIIELRNKIASAYYVKSLLFLLFIDLKKLISNFSDHDHLLNNAESSFLRSVLVEALNYIRRVTFMNSSYLIHF